MQKDVFAEPQLPKSHLKILQTAIAQDSTRLAHLIKKHNNLVKKGKTIPSHFKRIVQSVMSEFVESNLPLSRHRKNRRLKRGRILRNPFLTSDNFVKYGLSPFRKIVTESSTALSNLIQKSNIVNNKNKCMEIRPFSTKCFSNSKIPSSKESFNNNAFFAAESNVCTETEALKNIGSNNPANKNGEIQIVLDKNSNKSFESDPSSIISHDSILEQKCVLNSPTEDAVKSVSQGDITFDLEKDSESALCVISEVIGNADAAFSGADESQENAIEISEVQLNTPEKTNAAESSEAQVITPKKTDATETSEVQLITPKKTNDITKIKGWRRKQFFVERPTTIEFYRGPVHRRTKIELDDTNEMIETEESDNEVNPFVSESLDEFLDREAELKIGYEIPHLYAEFGIKLTSDEIVSRPNLPEKDIKEVELRYCVPLSFQSDCINFNEIKEENSKRAKRSIEDGVKPSKIVKLEETKRQSVRCAQRLEDKSKTESKRNLLESKNLGEDLSKNDSNSKMVTRSSKSLNNIKLASKLIALVVYPGPFMPLHPLVQYHLDKIRSYRTKVDRNWANFAASAVSVNCKTYNRSIVPVHCCVKMETSSGISSVNKSENIVRQKVDSISVSSEVSNEINSKTDNEEQTRLKKCSVVIERLDSAQLREPWCMEHSCYNCIQCGLGRTIFKGVRNSSQTSTKMKRQKEDSEDTVIVSPRASFDNKVASLLAKKVRMFKINGDTLTSIDCLKSLTPNTVEFIRLKFIKENFLTGYINIWYLKQETPTVKSRAFITFSKTPPVKNAINLKSSAFSLNNLPKVITEIVSAKSSFDSNEYAILYCDGEIWEIHGSLNVAFEKNDKNVEQIFTSVRLPELKKLQEIGYDILRVRIVKWWVLDLTQKFRVLEFKSGNHITLSTRDRFIENIALNLFGFLPLKTDQENRIFGAYMIQRLLPFVLIGPYYLLETHDLILRNDSSVVPFTYYGEENVTANYPLKFFINSVIKNVKKSNRKLEGLWLYDKMYLNNTNYLEVVTSKVKGALPKCSTIDIEHGYSLNSLTNSASLGGSPGIVQRKDGKDEFRNITVYLYFDIFELGFVEGKLQFDNSVIIGHPLDRRTKMKSHKIGDWFIGIIKRRIDFIPKDLTVKWFITKHKEDLGERRPFNKFFLGGAHILTKKGIYYMLEMSESKIAKLGLEKNEIIKAIAESEVIQEVRQLKKLANLLLNDPSRSLPMGEVLNKAVREIRKQRKLQRSLILKKILARRERLNLVSHFLEALNYCQIPVNLKLKMIEDIVPFFVGEDGHLSEDFIEKLKAFQVGRRYFRCMKKHYEKIKEKQEQDDGDIYLVEGKKLGLENMRPELQLVFGKYDTANLVDGVSAFQRPVVELVNIPNKIIEKEEDPLQISELDLQTENSNFISNKFMSFKTARPGVLLSSTSVKEQSENTFGEHKTRVNQKLQNNTTLKSDRFLELTSSDLPDNIKLCWRNWNIKKLEVA